MVMTGVAVNEIQHAVADAIHRRQVQFPGNDAGEAGPYPLPVFDLAGSRRDGPIALDKRSSARTGQAAVRPSQVAAAVSPCCPQDGTDHAAVDTTPA